MHSGQTGCTRDLSINCSVAPYGLSSDSEWALVCLLREFLAMQPEIYSPALTLLTPEVQAIVKSTVPALREHGTEIVSRFYSLLFLRYPKLKKMFNM